MTKKKTGIVVIVIFLFVFNEVLRKNFYYYCVPRRTMSDFEGFDNETGVERDIVPNIIHFVLTKPKDTLSFIEAICMLSALKNHNPDKIFLHTDLDQMYGFWQPLIRIESFRRKLVIIRVKPPNEVFGQKLHRINGPFHASDLLRIKALRKYGGIFLDTDSFVVNPLHRYFRYEMVLGLKENEFMGSQVLVAHPDARFLKLWYNTYRRYEGDGWYWNAGEKPTTDVLMERPELVHNEPERLGVENSALVATIMAFPKFHYKNLDTIHLLRRWRMKYFNEKNYFHFNNTMREMIEEILIAYPSLLKNYYSVDI